VLAAIRKNVGPSFASASCRIRVPARGVRGRGFPAAGARGDRIERGAGDRGPQDLYEPFLQTGSKVIVMDEKSAEVTKYARTPSSP